MDFIFLGTGTSQGVPMIAHEAPGLDLSNPKNWRTRPSVHVVMDGWHCQVDAGQDFRMQCLANDVRQIDTFLLTHAHADHVFGMDDLRRFCTLRGSEALPVYGNAPALEAVGRIFDYAVREKPINAYYPAFRLGEMPEVLEVGGGRIHSTPLPHGDFEVLGLVFEEASSGRRAAYYTDCKEVGPDARELARGADLLVLDGLQPEPHATHLSIPEAVAVAEAIGAAQTYFIHMNFKVDHEAVDRALPDGVALAWDGLRVEL